MAAWYRMDGVPIEATEHFLAGEGFTFTRRDNGDLIYTPATPNGSGILIMHGALIMPQSYANTAAYFAARGYTVFMPWGPGRLSIIAVERVAAELPDFGLDHWFFIGHSMGGMASLEMIEKHGAKPTAVALWAAAMPADFSGIDVPILYIWGDNDGLLPVERLEASKKNLPKHVNFVTLEGANHKNFAMYSHQFFDKKAKVSWIDQIDFANETTAEFFARFQ